MNAQANQQPNIWPPSGPRSYSGAHNTSASGPRLGSPFATLPPVGLTSSGNGGSRGFAPVDYNVAPYVPMIPPVDEQDPMEKLLGVEERLGYQEFTTRQLLEEALRQQHTMEENLDGAERAIKGEKRARNYLGDHLQTLTSLVKRLTRQNDSMEDRLNQLAKGLNNTNQMHDELSKKVSTNEQESKMRFDRVEAAISKLSSDLQVGFAWQANFKRDQDSRHELLLADIQQIKHHAEAVREHITRTAADTQVALKDLHADIDRSCAQLDSKNMGIIDDLRSQFASGKRYEEVERGKLSGIFQQQLEHTEHLMGQRAEQYEKGVEIRLIGTERLLKDERDARPNWEARINSTIAQQFSQWKERIEESDIEHRNAVKESRTEFAQGLHAVKLTLETMHNILETKREVLEDDLRSQLKKVVKTIIVQ